MASHPSGQLVAGGLVRRRKRINRGAEAVAWISAGAAVAVLALVVVSVFEKGIGALDWSLLTTNPAIVYGEHGGIANSLVGTAVLVGVATLMAVPIGVLVAVYVSEFARPAVGRALRLALDVINGIPSIVIGIFLFALVVYGRGQSAFAASLALAVIMLPLVSRAAQEVLVLVPRSLREASLALGVSKWRTVLRVVLPTTLGGILTGTILAVARAAGETAPLLFTCSIAYPNYVSVDLSHTVASIPITIFIYSEAPDPALHEQAWAAAFLLIAFVLVTSLLARWLLHRSARRLRGEAVGQRALAGVMGVFARRGGDTG
jgi:phosphate transport system permease protein